ncbi:hypothetical protein [Actinomadura rubrisoli]|uniref:Uncharacterized protein n=1 Tax=Actinomadura rubrisoli TaxID=2530368 RepID=A0A4R5CGV2_9ACTN|nr:hypothetical protein [Actinomadura rubrisoli]TDD97720.1 hypothetical protein E1298_01400 [Actinomadura rubrisoli]
MTSSNIHGPVTNADRRRWQRRNQRLLAELLEFGEDKELPEDAELPVVWWQVTEHGLVGDCMQAEYADRRVAFDAWTDLLGLRRWPERTSPGCTHLHAASPDWRGRGVSVIVRADVLADDPDDG